MRIFHAVTTIAVVLLLASCANKEEPKTVPEEIPVNKVEQPAKPITPDSTSTTIRVGTKQGDGSVTTSTTKKTKTNAMTIEETNQVKMSADSGITITTTKKKR